MPDQEVPTTIFVNTLNDYDIALRALFQESKLNEDVYTRLSEKIGEAISNINAASTEEQAKVLYDDMVEEILKKTSESVANVDKAAQLEKIATNEKTKREQKQKLATEIFNRFKELAVEEGVSSELNPHINEALKNIENAKTAKDVDNELSEFRRLLNADTYGNLKTKFDAQEDFLTAQKDALTVLDAYESALDAIQDSNVKTAIENALKLAREEIMAADEEGRVNQVVGAFESQVVAEYPNAKKSVAKKLVSDALAEALQQLEAYKTGAYAEEKLVQLSAGKWEVVKPEKTIKQLADEKIALLQTIANGLLQDSAIDTTTSNKSYKKVNTDLQTYVDNIDAEIEKIKDNMRENQEAYLQAYEEALEELEIYEANAEKYGLTGEALEYVKTEVVAVKAKIASVDTEGEVNAAMGLFRNGIKQYSPEFDAYQVTETRKAVKEALEEYKELNDADINNAVVDAVADLEKAGTVDAIKKIERDAMEAIIAEIKDNELASAKLEARKEFLVFIEEENSQYSQYSKEVKELASEAISKIKDAYSVADVNTQVEKYRSLIDKQLKLDNTSMQAEVAKARESALKEIAIYEEIATAAKDTGTLNRISAAKAAISSETATLKSIDTAKSNLIRDIRALGLPIVSAKVDAIDWLRNIGAPNYYTYALNTTNVGTYLKDYTEGRELSYNKLVKDAYINSQFEKAFNMVKDAADVDAVNVQKNGIGAGIADETHSGTKDNPKTARGVIVKAVNSLVVMEKARGEELANLDTLMGAYPELEDLYEAQVKAVDMNAYNSNPSIFDEIYERAEIALENHVKDLIKSEAQANLNVESVNDSIKEANGGNDTLFNTKIDQVQEDVSVSTNNNGEGKVTGTLHKQNSTDFTQNFTQKTGYYLVLSFTSETAKRIEYERSGVSTGSGVLDEDRILVIWFENEEALANTKLVISFYGDDEENPIQTITISDFSDLDLKPQID